VPKVGFDLRAVESDEAVALPFGTLGGTLRAESGWPSPTWLELAGSEAAPELRYLPGRLSASAAETFAGQLAALAEGASDSTPWQRIDLLGAGHRDRLAVEPRVSASAEPVHETILRQARQTPHAVAVAAGAECLSYGELDRRSALLAAALRQRGTGREAPVAICLPRGVEIPTAILAVLRAGGCYVAIDPDTPPARRDAVLAASGARLMITRPALGAGDGVSCPTLDPASLRGAPEAPAAAPGAASPELPEQAAYVVFTSGSTGVPKGVTVSHRSLSAYVRSARGLLGVSGDSGGRDRQLVTVSTFAADLGNTTVFPALASGGTLHVATADEALDPRRFAGAMGRARADVLKIGPSHLRAMLEAAGASALPHATLVLGGERLPAPLLDEVREAAARAGRVAPRVVNHYGPTETTVGAVAWPLPEAGRPAEAGPEVPIGSPLAHAAIRLVEAGGIEPVPAGVAGELLIVGAGVARGYVDRPGETAARFVPDPFGTAPGGRAYRTGDLVHSLPAGELVFRRRLDDQVKIRGHRVEPAEVEAVLGRHPGIGAAAVVARSEADGPVRLDAYVVARGGERALGDAPASALRGWLEERLPEPMVPATFTLLAALPLTSNGKLDRSALPVPAALGAGDTGPRSRPPGGAVERVLAEVWRDTLRVEAVGRDDDYFELGGDSILSIQIVARARRRGVEITVGELFEQRTVAALATVARAAAHAVEDHRPAPGPAPLTAVARRFFALGLAEPHHFNMSLLFEVCEPLRAGCLERAARAVVEHHDALRLRFDRTEAGWRQRVAAEAGPSPAAVVDLSGLPPERSVGGLERAAGRLQRSLDLSRGPLARFVLFRLAGSDRLFLIVHHLAVDAVSWRILLEDLEAAYRSAERGEAVALPQPTTSFRRWAERVAEHARSDRLAAQAPYWLDRPTSVRGLPVDAPGGVNDEGAARTLTTMLDPERTGALLQAIPSTRGARIHEVAVAALAAALRAWAGGDGVLIEIEGHGREELFPGVDLSRTVGWFTSYAPLYLDLSGARPEDRLGTLEAVRRAYRHLPERGVGYGLLRHMAEGEAAERVRDLPEPEIYFNYLGQLDGVLDHRSMLRPAAEDPGSERSPTASRPRLLGVHASVADGRLAVVWTYGERLYRRETIEGLAGRFREELERLVDACLATGAREARLEDFPDVDLSQRELDNILGQLGGSESPTGGDG
jgi:amino acid adenylation domain-containing protein/non-ribosomal peptide synthase protein (TIGR01720 family)